MIKSILAVAGLSMLCGLLASCGTTAAAPQGTPVAVTMSDSAPAGVTVLAFSMTVSGMSMADSAGNSANLLTAPVTVNFQHLLTQNTLLTNTAAPPNTYESMTITFSNPSATILNASGGTITVGASSCASGQICTLTPTLNQVSVTISKSPFPLTIASTAIGLDVDLNLSNALQGNLSLTPAVVVSQTTASSSSVLNSLNANGQVTSVNGSSFTMTDASTGNALTFSTASNTTFTNFTTNTTNCITPNTSACVAANQNINISYNIPLPTPANLQATSVILKSNITNGIEGTVIAAPTQGTPNQFTMVVTGFSPSRTGVTIGETLTVTAPTSSSAFAVLPVNGITIPSSLAFSGASSTAVGQTLDIDGPSVSPTSGSSSTATTATTVLLVPSQFLGTLSAINGPNLTVNGLNSVFTTGAVTSLTVNTQAGTQFLGVPLSGLVANQPITIGGEVFTGTSGITVVAGQVGQFLTAVPAS